MDFISSRDARHRATLSEALRRGLAPDGGLYMPQTLSSLPLSSFQGERGLPEIAEWLLAPFFEGDALASRLGEIARTAFDFPAPLTALTPPHPGPVLVNGGEGKGVEVLELFHGPTAAFKDFGARFLAG